MHVGLSFFLLLILVHFFHHVAAGSSQADNSFIVLEIYTSVQHWVDIVIINQIFVVFIEEFISCYEFIHSNAA